MFVVDTNLLLYAVNPDAADHERAYELLGSCAWSIPWSLPERRA